MSFWRRRIRWFTFFGYESVTGLPWIAVSEGRSAKEAILRAFLEHPVAAHDVTIIGAIEGRHENVLGSVEE